MNHMCMSVTWAWLDGSVSLSMALEAIDWNDHDCVYELIEGFCIDFTPRRSSACQR